MKSLFFAPIIMVFCLTAMQAQETPHFAAPSAEHLWLKRFVGQWETATEIFMEPGNPPVHGKGSEQVKAIGDYWILSAGQGEMLGNHELCHVPGLRSHRQKIHRHLDRLHDQPPLALCGNP